MSKMTPKEMAAQIGGGLLSFPVTPFKADLSFDEKRYRENLDWLCGYDVAGLFAAGGTGEFFSLTPAEVERVVSVAVGLASTDTIWLPGATRSGLAMLSIKDGPFEL